MLNYKKYTEQIFDIKTENEFIELCLTAFKYQYKNNEIYKQYCNFLKIKPEKVNNTSEIPFLPISFFKTHKIITKSKNFDIIFTSSSTTGSTPSSHYISDIEIYKKSFIKNFEYFYSSPNEYVILALLPSYLERSGSSLIYMLRDLINLSNNKESGFFLNQYQDLQDTILSLEKKSQKYILLGISFALLDFAEEYKLNLNHGIVMETGGMKGRRKEITRYELHKILKTAFSCENIHSEYGMTELLSQAYSKKDGIFECPPQMRVLIRDPYDALSVKPNGKGALNIIDLANINSCCFIETSDLGSVFTNGNFEVSGRFDVSEIRGCNLMISE